MSIKVLPQGNRQNYFLTLTFLYLPIKRVIPVAAEADGFPCLYGVGFFRVSRNLVGINFRHPNVMPNFAVWKTITYRHWHRWCCQPRF